MYILVEKCADDSGASFTLTSLGNSATSARPEAHAPQAAPSEPAQRVGPAEQALSLEEPVVVSPAELPALVQQLERRHQPRWVWESTNVTYQALLTAGVSVQRCHDLRLCHAILAHSAHNSNPNYPRDLVLPDIAAQPDAAAYGSSSDASPTSNQHLLAEQGELFAALAPAQPSAQAPARRPHSEQMDAAKSTPCSLPPAQSWLRAQLAAVESSASPHRLALLLAAESAAALVAAELQHHGLPWDAAVHQSMLENSLGPEPANYERPAKMQVLADQISAELNAPGLNPDSPQDLIRALHRAGIEVSSTRSGVLEKVSHPAIAPLLAYKKLARLYSANGWHWLRQWVRAGRFHSEYIVGGVPSGRWASRGGGALQIPAAIRQAVRAEPGCKLVVVDAAQIEPRVLIALAQDVAMAQAARGKDLYAGIAAEGFGGERDKAKRGLLGALYGATSGESGRLMPQLRKLYPRAMGLVDQAARDGEAGKSVTTYLGRSTGAPSEAWQRLQRTTTAEQQRAADAAARSRGRFTRNFLVQGSAAEWANCWLAQIRLGLRANPQWGGELTFFLHDEVMVHCLSEHSQAVASFVADCAERAKELIYGVIPVPFPVSTAIVDSYDQAK